MNPARLAIEAQERAIERDRREWAELERLADGDLAAFYNRYADYLEQWGAISERRKFLIRAFRETAERLREQPNG